MWTAWTIQKPIYKKLHSKLIIIVADILSQNYDLVCHSVINHTQKSCLIKKGYHL